MIQITQLGMLCFLGLLAVLFKIAAGDKVCKVVGSTTYSCDDDKECCDDNTSCCSEYWTTWRIIVIAGAGVIGLGVFLVLVIACVYHVCCKKTSKNNNTVNVQPQQQPQIVMHTFQPMPGGSAYNQPPPSYEPPPYQRNAETPFQHPPPLPAYEDPVKKKPPTYGEKKNMVNAIQEANDE